MNDNKNPKSVYPPKMRSFSTTSNDEKLFSCNTNTFSNISEFEEDPIVVNNIACPEFDYTENLADEETTK
ncbi:hypothetical protein [uncultured Clostridium sp.]|jgi:hypothetical protein|uniref:hypothetical protein n=1 Tax=uncultured Clostridium sp. TaxID=59620 RepID=UPI00261D71D6|nr:hypothetical protein [uncultured Clostridium sp.]